MTKRYGHNIKDKKCLNCENLIQRGSVRCWSCNAKNRYKNKKNHPRWKGNKVGYRGLHNFIEKELGKPDKCEICEAFHLMGHDIHWANISGEYKRDLDDWKRLCAKCHTNFDGRRK